MLNINKSGGVVWEEVPAALVEVPVEEAVGVQEEVTEVLEGILTVLVLEVLEVIIQAVRVVTEVVEEVLEGHMTTVHMEVVMALAIDHMEVIDM